MAPVSVSGVVESVEYLELGQGARIVLKDVSIEKVDASNTPRKIRLKVRDPSGLASGARIEVLASLNPPSGPAIPGAFDFRKHAYFKGIGAVGFAYYAPTIVEQRKGFAFAHIVESTRQAIMERVQAIAAPDVSGVMAALIIGNKRAIAEEDQEAMRAAGLAHMLAISGLHVGLVTGFLFFISRFFMAAFPAFALTHPIKKYAALFAFACALLYMLLAGATVPTQRAVAMTGLVLLAVVLDRSAFTLRLVAFAALVVLILAPEALLSASFHLSFAAVVALVVFYDTIREGLSSWYAGAGWMRKVALYVVGVCFTSLVAGLATAPFSLFHFQEFASYNILANVITMPVLAFIVMPAAVLAFILMPFGLDALPFWVMGEGVRAILQTAHWVESLPGAVLSWPSWPHSALVLMTFGFLFMALWKGRFKILGLVFLSIGLIQIYNYNQYDVFISSSSDLISYKEENTLYASNLKRNKFTRNIWERQSGLEENSTQRFAEGSAQCGEDGCRLILKGRKIAFPNTPYVHRTDCNWADIFIASDPLSIKKRECTASHIIDKFSTWRHGAHAIRINVEDGKISIENAASKTGERLWSTARGNLARQ